MDSAYINPYLYLFINKAEFFLIRLAPRGMGFGIPELPFHYQKAKLSSYSTPKEVFG